MIGRDPVLKNLPVPIVTSRLILQPPCLGDGLKVNEAILESFDELHRWMRWATHKPSVEESEFFVRVAQAKWILREELTLFIFNKLTGQFLGGTGFHHLNWHVPSFEIGYWIRTSCAHQGIITESTNALVRYAFQVLNAVRVEIRCDSNNGASRRIPEKLCFEQEGILLKSTCESDGALRDTVVYARYDDKSLPDLEVAW